MHLFKHTLAALLLAGMGFASVAQAALIPRTVGGDEMVYDSDLNITWLKNANTNGQMDWNTATDWAANLVYGGFDDWRLPTADPACGFNYNCTGSELGHLFYQELGATADNSILNGNPTELAKFSNIQQTNAYWSGTEYAPDPLFAWNFVTGFGDQSIASKLSPFYGWAVRDGDVAAIPLPAAVWLFGSALSGVALLGVRRRRG